MEPTTKREQAVIYARTIITPLCTKPELIEIQDILDERGLVLNIHVHDDDAGLLIGRSGKVINSLRTVLHIWGSRNVAAVKLFIINERK